MPPRPQPALSRSLQLALFLTGLAWLIPARIAAVQAARGLAQAVHALDWQPLLQAGSFLFLLLAGFSCLSWIATRVGGVRAVNALPRRPTAAREWKQGTALGWGLFLLAALPSVLIGALHPEFAFTAHAFYELALATGALALSSLAVEVAFRGFLFRQLIGALNPTAAALVLSGIFALASSYRGVGVQASPESVQVTFCAGLLFSIAYLRTHGLWLGWGLRFGWTATMAILFGLPLSGSTDYASVVSTDAYGPHWITGGAYGPEGALWTAFVLLLGIAALYRLTRDYAWDYTHSPIIPGAYAVVVPPPAAHVAMETEAAKPVLVQIASITPAAPSTLPEATEHLRAREP